MKAVINGLLYDTETAHRIGDAGNRAFGGDFHRWEETLYRTEAGRYFVAGEGGPMTRWAETFSDRTSKGGSGIIPLSERDALAWAEQNLEPDHVAEVFEPLIERA